MMRKAFRLLHYVASTFPARKFKNLSPAQATMARGCRARTFVLRRLVPCAAAPILGALLLYAQPDITGFWAFKTPRSDGSSSMSFFELKQSGETITGNTVNLYGRGGTPIGDGTFRSGRLRFTIAPAGRGGQAGQPLAAATIYEGTLADGKFAVTVTGGRGGRGGPVTGELERTTRLDKLAVPELREVRDNGLARTPPMGWNSWNKFAGRIDDKTTREIADAIVSSGMKKAGYVYVNLDDTWEGERDANGEITGNNKFPDMKALADYVHSKGLKIGIYSTPGPRTCAGYEGSHGHEEQDARTFARWGMDYLKYDWCTAAGIYYDTEAQAVFQKMGEALLKTSRPMLYSLSYSIFRIWEIGPKVGAGLWRTSDDIRDDWQSVDQIGFGPRVPIGPGQPGQPRPLGLTQYDIAEAGTVGHWNDPDILEVGNGRLTTDEYKTHFSLWCLLRAPLLAGNDLRDMTEDTISILTNSEAIAIDQDPAGAPLKRVSENPDRTLIAYMRPLADGAIAVGLFNRGAAPAEMGVTWDSLGLAGKKMEVRDLWEHQAVAVPIDKYTVTVPMHGVVLLRVTAR